MNSALAQAGKAGLRQTLYCNWLDAPPPRFATPANWLASAIQIDRRCALATQGLGSFHGADYLMVVYGCYRVLCDFDLMKLNAAQVGVGPFAAIALVDDGGQTTRRHHAYYMSKDGRRVQAAYVSTPLRCATSWNLTMWESKSIPSR